jgi:hypothetical protein
METVDPRVDPDLLPAQSRAVIAKDPRGKFKELPVLMTPCGQLITRWNLTDEERRDVANGADVFVTMVTRTIVPMLVTIGPVDWTAPIE